MHNLTIVIPTYERQSFLARQSRYWSIHPVKLLILDGSTRPWNPDHLWLRDRPNVEYVHAETSIDYRLRMSMDLVTTQYVALLSDDEFFLPSSLAACVKFLEEHRDYSSCKGNSVTFYVRHPEPTTGIKIMGKRCYPELYRYNLSQDDGAQRMQAHMSPYTMASLWAVQRLHCYRAAVASIPSRQSFGSAAATEISFSLVNSYLGKVHVLDNLMWLRSKENANAWWASGRKPFREWWTHESHDERNRFVEKIQFGVAQADVVPPASGQVLEAINAYCLQSQPSMAKNARKKLHTMSQQSALLSPAARAIKSILSILRPLRAQTWMPLEHTLAEAEDNGVLISRIDMSGITAAITQHYDEFDSATAWGENSAT